jgi:NADH-quinone oxidoreductase subunit N
MLLSASDFFFSYLSLEGLSFSLYALASLVFYNKKSLEATIKYFILGGVASAIFAYGISLLLIYSNSIFFFDTKFFFLLKDD